MLLDRDFFALVCKQQHRDYKNTNFGKQKVNFKNNNNTTKAQNKNMVEARAEQNINSRSNKEATWLLKNTYKRQQTSDDVQYFGMLHY